MRNNQKICDLIDQMQNLELEKAYFIYIKFCYKIILLLELDNISSGYILESIKLAKLFWLDSEISINESELINRRVEIIKYMKEKNISYDVNVQPKLKFLILPLWTKPPSDDIGDSLDWAFTLLRAINISDYVISLKLSEALLEIDS